MRKFNISRKLYDEIKKGNLYILDNGNSASEEEVLNLIKKRYISAIEDGSVDMSLSYKDFEEYNLRSYARCDDILKILRNKFGIDCM